MAGLHKELRTHPHNPRILAESAKVYARDKTPEIASDGAVSELDVKPGGPDLAARHVREIHRMSGDAGVRRTVQGLQVTRGNQFVLQMLNHDQGVKDLLAPQRASNPGVPVAVQTALETNDAGQPLPADVRDQFAQATGHDPADVRLFDDHRAHDAAASVGARAFTVGQRIFFNRGENDPGRPSGRELFMHELVHTVQQKGAGIPRAAELEISTAGDRQEHEAEHVARSVLGAERKTAANDGQDTHERVAGRELFQAGSSQGPRLQRVISFTVANNAPTTNAVVANETAGGFELTSPDPTFEWTPDVTIHGDPGDPFAEWETAHHQVAKGFWTNVWWGAGADRTHRQVTINGGLPMRDATAAGNTWYSDWRAQGFAADGDVRSPVMHDTPSTGVIPWDNPVAGRAGNSGFYNYGFGFVSTVSARHTTAGTGAAAFRHLGHMHWNFMLNGRFDAALPLNGRVTVNGGAVNHSPMYSGFDPANRPMHGGDIVNDNFHETDT
jgi:hypothetical protein